MFNLLLEQPLHYLAGFAIVMTAPHKSIGFFVDLWVQQGCHPTRKVIFGHILVDQGIRACTP